MVHLLVVVVVLLVPQRQLLLVLIVCLLVVVEEVLLLYHLHLQPLLVLPLVATGLGPDPREAQAMQCLTH